MSEKLFEVKVYYEISKDVSDEPRFCRSSFKKFLPYAETDLEAREMSIEKLMNELTSSYPDSNILIEYCEIRIRRSDNFELKSW